LTPTSPLEEKGTLTPWHERLLFTLSLSLTFLWIYSGQSFLAHNVDNDADSSFFVYGAQVLLSGGTLYQDFWDQKPPMIFWQNALLLKLFGRDFHAWAWVHGLVIAGLFLLWAKEIRHRVGTPMTSLGLLLLAFMFNSNKVLDFGNRTEFGVACMEMLALIMVLKAWRKQEAKSLIIAGGASAVAFFFKPVGMASFLATLAWCALGRSRSLPFPFLKSTLIGFFGTSGLLSIPLLITGQWANMLEASILLPLQFSGAGTPGLLEAFSNAVFRMGPFWGIVAGLALLPLALFFSRGKDRSLLIWLSLFFLATLSGIILQRHGRPHYDHPLALPLVTLTLISLHALIQKIRSGFFRVIIPVGWLMLTLFFGQYFIRQQLMLSLHQKELSKEKTQSIHQVSRLIKSELKPDETFYYWSIGYAPYLLTDRSSPGRISPAFAAFGGAGVELMREDLLRVKATPHLAMILENLDGPSGGMLNPEDHSLPTESRTFIKEYLEWRDASFKALEHPELLPYRLYRRNRD